MEGTRQAFQPEQIRPSRGNASQVATFAVGAAL